MGITVLLFQSGLAGPAPVSVRNDSDVFGNPHIITFLPVSMGFPSILYTQIHQFHLPDRAVRMDALL